jgi:hypothetical protein
MANVFVVNAFDDLKLKSSGGGGFSDGGVVNESKALLEEGGSPVDVEIAPPPGEVYSGAGLGSVDGITETGSVSACNNNNNSVDVAEYFVSEDGTETLLSNTTVNDKSVATVTRYFEAGGRLQYPNKLRYRLGGKNNPTKRVLLKYTLPRFDRPSDQTLS